MLEPHNASHSLDPSFTGLVQTLNRATSSRETREWFLSEEDRVNKEIESQMERARNFTLALSRHRYHSEDKPLFTPVLDETFAQLDEIVDASTAKRKANRTTATKHHSTFRLGSIAAHRQQVDFYHRLAASPAIRTICEVGFNAGHSTAVWLAANPTAHVYSFDLFGDRFSKPCFTFLRDRFRGADGVSRLFLRAGDSSQTVRATAIPAGCDLVHVDGRHDYEHTMGDFLSLLRARWDSNSHTPRAPLAPPQPWTKALSTH